MNTNRSMAWLREAVGGIKYPPDRRRVEKELYAIYEPDKQDGNQ